MLQKLQTKDIQAHKIRLEELGKNWKYSDWILHHQDLSYIPKTIKIEPINKDHSDLLEDHSDIEKIYKLIVRKYF